ncbi:DinB family protein [Paenibacillus sp. TAF58]
MKSKELLIKEFSTLILFVQSLRQLDDGTWVTPIEESKWTTRDVVAHLMFWDKYFFEEAIEKITTRQQVTSQHLNFDEFNKRAIEYAKIKEKQEIIDMTIHYRNEILRHLGLIPEEEFVKEHVDGDGNNFSVYNYLMGFIPHDAQHINQLKDFLATVQTS